MNGKDDRMNYTELSRQYDAEAERIKERISILRKAEPGAYWQKLEQNRALDIMDDMYLDCLTVSRYLKRRGVFAHETM